MKIMILCAFLLPSLALADVPVMSKESALRLGYVPAPRSLVVKHTSHQKHPIAKHSLPWPVEFQDATHTLGNSMSQYQEYGDGEPYWHGGDDLRTGRKAWVTTPVAGTLNGGHYSYVTNADGSMVKYIKPWPQTGPSAYFEINVTTADGVRFQFHHVDRQTLTPEVIALLNKGGGPIAAGTRVGQVVVWSMEKPYGMPYHHTHYDIVAPGEKELNPEFFSTLIPDRTPPTLHGVYVKSGSVHTKLAERTRLSERPSELVIANTDEKDGNAYVQPADYIALEAQGQKFVLWDMRERLLTPDGKYPDIRQSFAETLRTNQGTLRTQGNYSGDMFLARVALPASVRGDVEIVLMDQAGNRTTFALTLP